jgi:hypothetical protein
MPARKAAQSVYQASNGHPLAALLVKEIGIFPPGCFVKLYSGELAVVTYRGEAANTPHAAALTNRQGEAMLMPCARNTALKDSAIVTEVSSKAVLVRVPLDKLYPATDIKIAAAA